MRTIFADFNALTDAEHVRLTTRGSLDDIPKNSVQPGEWIWLSDGELQGWREDRRGSHLSTSWHSRLGNPGPSSRCGGSRFWWSLFGAGAFIRETAHAGMRLHYTSYDHVCVETKASDDARNVIGPGFFDFRRAAALLELGRLELALLAVEEALKAQPAKDAYVYFCLELLKRIDLDRALSEAHRRVLDS